MDASDKLSDERITTTVDEEEIIHFTQCINAFKGYKKSALKGVDLCASNYEKLPDSHKRLLPDYYKVLEEKRICIERNDTYLKDVITCCGDTFTNSTLQEVDAPVACSSFDISKVKSTLKQIVRDWSTDGASERLACYDPIIKEVLKYKPLTDPENEDVKVLVPGCGLGRLTWELARHGYHGIGNEFSFFMLFVSSQILNNCDGDSPEDFHQYQIHPWVEQTCNVKEWRNVLKAINFPDVWPASLPFENRFCMLAGDFLEICTTENEYDCVASCFFLDTAHNIISYLENIYRILKPGGILVNNGPLLYHFSEMKDTDSIELSFEDILNILPKIGFKIIKTEWLASSYTCNPASMMKYQYQCGLFVAEKPTTTAPS